jgi:hypothetical protein
MVDRWPPAGRLLRWEERHQVRPARLVDPRIGLQSLRWAGAATRRRLLAQPPSQVAPARSRLMPAAPARPSEAKAEGHFRLTEGLQQPLYLGNREGNQLNAVAPFSSFADASLAARRVTSK